MFKEVINLLCEISVQFLPLKSSVSEHYMEVKAKEKVTCMVVHQKGMFCLHSQLRNQVDRRSISLRMKTQEEVVYVLATFVKGTCLQAIFLKCNLQLKSNWCAR